MKTLCFSALIWHLLSLSLLWFSNNAVATDFKEIFTEQVLKDFSEQLPGYAVAVITPGSSFTLTHGVRKKGEPSLIDENTVFRLASVSKTFTPAAFILSQSSQQLDRPISAYLPELQFSRKDYQGQLTTRHLLSQTTGLIPHAYTNLVQANVPYSRIVGQLKDVNFVCAPGKCYGYQNVVYSLAGDVIAKASGQTYEAVVEQRIFRPLNMKDASFGLEAITNNPNHALPHRWDKTQKQWQPIEHSAKYYSLAPAAGVNATIKDMQQWLKAQLGQYPKVLSEEQLHTMHTPHIKTTQKHAHYLQDSWEGVSDTHYALGWRVFSFNGQAGFVHHGGWVKGFRIEMVFNRELGVGLVFLSNSESRIASDIVPRFIRLFLEGGYQTASMPDCFQRPLPG